MGVGEPGFWSGRTRTGWLRDVERNTLLRRRHRSSHVTDSQENQAPEELESLRSFGMLGCVTCSHVGAG